MKTLQRFTASLMMALCLGLSLASCNDEAESGDFNTQPQANQPQTLVNIPEINKEVKDSLDKYTAKIDSISKDTKVAIDQVTSMKEQVSNLESNEVWWWSFCGIAIFAVLLAIMCIIRCASLNKRLNRHRDEIEELKRDQQTALFAPKSVAKTSTPADYESLKRRIFNMESQIHRLSSAPRSVQQSVESVVTPHVSDARKNGYFGNPIAGAEPYFKKLLSSCDSDARFSVEISGDKAIFRPLESASYLGTFKSIDAPKLAIEFKGQCALSDANYMKVITPGEAISKDGKWVITKKATVYLS